MPVVDTRPRGQKPSGDGKLGRYATRKKKTRTEEKKRDGESTNREKSTGQRCCDGAEDGGGPSGRCADRRGNPHTRSGLERAKSGDAGGSETNCVFRTEQDEAAGSL